MPRLFDCPVYVQSDEKGASQTLRNSCLKCGRTREAHEVEPERPSNEAAEEWLTQAGYRHQPYFELARVILTRYIEYQRSIK